MSVTGIDAALDRAVQQLSGDHRVKGDTREAILEAFERFLREAGVVKFAPAGAADGNGVSTRAIGTQPLLPDARASAYAAAGAPSSLLRDPSAPALEQLPGTLAAGDEQYNAREAMLRDRLNLPELERRLRSAAESCGIAYSSDDLEGILRNAGYDAVHMGSSDRYMAAVDRFTVEAENRYRERAGNVPGSNA